MSGISTPGFEQRITMFRVLCCLMLLQLCLSVTVLQVDETMAVDRITELIEDLSDDMPPVIRNPAAKLVRLSFHDCVGGCDGCINLNNADNNGLQDIYARVNAIYENEGYNTTGMSRGDFIALAGTAAIRQASSRQTCQRLNLPPNCNRPVPAITIRFGRTDCPTSPMTTIVNDFPNPHGDLDHVLAIFRDRMNMTIRETVAILGAHTLGDAGITRSGFRGPWVPQTAVFDNMFYRQLRAPDWFQEEINEMNSPVFPESRYQWTLERNMGPNLLMLNTDVAVWRYISPNSDGLEENVTCRAVLGDCEPSDTADIVDEFATDNDAFHTVFGAAFQKLIENGYADSELVTAIEDNPTNTTTNTTTMSPTTQPTTRPTIPDSGVRPSSTAGLIIVITIIIVMIFTFSF